MEYGATTAHLSLDVVKSIRAMYSKVCTLYQQQSSFTDSHHRPAVGMVHELFAVTATGNWYPVPVVYKDLEQDGRLPNRQGSSDELLYTVSSGSVMIPTPC
jgi:hypothetical protein